MNDWIYLYILDNKIVAKIVDEPNQTIEQLESYGLDVPQGGKWMREITEELIDRDDNVIQEGVYEDLP